MQLRGAIEATAVDLVPIGYQSRPVYEIVGDKADDDDVDDWLMIKCRVVDPRGDWDFLDPCLTVAEGAELGTWLRRAAAGEVPVDPPGGSGEVAPSLLFTEPNLSFSVADRDAATVTLRVHFSYESAPPWAADNTTSPQHWVCVTATPATVRTAVALTPVGGHGVMRLEGLPRGGCSVASRSGRG